MGDEMMAIALGVVVFLVGLAGAIGLKTRGLRQRAQRADARADDAEDERHAAASKTEAEDVAEIKAKTSDAFAELDEAVTDPAATKFDKLVKLGKARR